MKSPFAVLSAFCFLAVAGPAAETKSFFEIQIIDKATRRGIPLVELVTVDGVRWITDNAGRIAYADQGHAGETIFFSGFPQGYRVPKDGLGVEGVRLKVEPGKRAE